MIILPHPERDNKFEHLGFQSAVSNLVGLLSAEDAVGEKQSVVRGFGIRDDGSGDFLLPETRGKVFE